MRVVRAGFAALLPPALLVLYVLVIGNFQSAGRFSSAWLGLLVPWAALGLAAFYGLGGRRLIDPLGLGRLYFLVPALYAVVLLSWWLSPVSRSGLVGVVLIPAYLCLPAAIGTICRLRADSAWLPADALALRALLVTTLLLSLVALWLSYAFWQSWAEGSRVALPMGHHNLQGAIAVALLPFCLTRMSTPFWRTLAFSTLVVSMLVLIGTRSLGTSLALGVQALVLVVWWLSARARGQKSPRWVGALATSAALLMPLALLLPRLAGVLSRADSSVAARFVYWRAGLSGFFDRPLLGWGPGSTHWLLAEWLRPEPGINPPGEVVSDLHGLPVQILFELGGIGFCLVLALLLCFFVRHGRAHFGRPAEPVGVRPSTAAGFGLTLGQAAYLGLLGLCVCWLFLSNLSVPALPMTAVLLAGLLQTTLTNRSGSPVEGEPPAANWKLVLATLTGAALSAVILLRPLLALGLYEEARLSALREAPDEVVAESLAQSVALDPEFPLYRARWAWFLDRERAAEEAHQAAVSARGLAPLWLSAGYLGTRLPVDPAREQTLDALERACRLSPLDALAPFFLYRVSSSESELVRARFLARALLAEAGLLAAPDLFTDTSTRDLVSREIKDWQGVPAGLRLGLSEVVLREGTSEPEIVRLAFSLDEEESTAFSLHVFRRQPWRRVIARVEVDAGRFEEIKAELVNATALRETGREAFTPEACSEGLRTDL